MATKADLEAIIETLRAAEAELRAEHGKHVHELSELNTTQAETIEAQGQDIEGYKVQSEERAITIEVRDAQIAELELKLSVPITVKPSVIKPTPIGSISVPSGLLILVDAQVGEAGWTSRTGGNREFVVDVIGNRAEYHANITRLPHEAIPGGRRLMGVPKLQAEVLAAQIKKNASVVDGDDTTALVMSSVSTYFLARKATEQGVGSAPIGFGNHGGGFSAAVPSKAIPVSADFGADGRVTSLHFNLS